MLKRKAHYYYSDIIITISIIMMIMNLLYPVSSMLNLLNDIFPNLGKPKFQIVSLEIIGV